MKKTLQQQIKELKLKNKELQFELNESKSSIINGDKENLELRNQLNCMERREIYILNFQTSLKSQIHLLRYKHDDDYRQFVLHSLSTNDLSITSQGDDMPF